MGKPASVRQKEYRENLKKKNLQSYLAKERDRKKKKLSSMKNAEAERQGVYKNFLKKDKDRKRINNKGDNVSTTSLDNSFTSRQAFGKSIARTKRNLPGSPSKKAAIIATLIQEMTPTSKSKVYKKGRKRCESWRIDRPKMEQKRSDNILAFLESPHISYTMPGKKQTVYCGKDKTTGEKVNKPKHYLNWCLKEVVGMYNNLNEGGEVSYYAVQSAVRNNRHIFLTGQYPSDDCRCQDCENAELFLLSLKREMRSSKRSDLAASICEDPTKFLEKFMCSIKVEDCVKGLCDECPAGAKNEIIEFLSALEEFKYSQWVHEEKFYKKVIVVEDGKGAAEQFSQVVLGQKFRRHLYGSYRQHSELKYLKGILKPGEVICSVDFANNYENKQRNEIQNAFFGHESFSIFTAAVYYKEQVETDSGEEEDSPTDLHVWSAAIVSNETKHERNLAFSCTNKLIDEIRKIIPSLKKLYFWSDGCTKEFRSQYTFRMLAFFPSDLTIKWSYGESHHFKGPHDGIGGALKSKVFSDVKSGRAMINNAKDFVHHGDTYTKIAVFYIEKDDLQSPNVSDSVYVKGTQRVHHVERGEDNDLSFYDYANYKKGSNKIHEDLMYDSVEKETISLRSADEPMELDTNTNKTSSVNIDENVDKEDLWVVVSFEGDKYPGIVVSNNENGGEVVKVMHKLKKGWYWPSVIDQIAYKNEDIVMRGIEAPKKQNKVGRPNYIFNIDILM